MNKKAAESSEKIKTISSSVTLEHPANVIGVRLNHDSK